MPIRPSKSRLWFRTKEEEQEYDDKMISSIELKSDDMESENYSPVFTRSKKEFVLGVSDKVVREAESIMNIQRTNRKAFYEKYVAGKNDNTSYREWTFHKLSLAYGGCYLLLRELPIRNFYARSFLMFCFLSKMSQDYLHFLPFAGQSVGIEDQWTGKNIRNYSHYHDVRSQVIPSNYNKLPEHRVWKLGQAGYLRRTPERFAQTQHEIFVAPSERNLAWDGTFNMPLEGIAHPLHKDAKYVDFIVA